MGILKTQILFLNSRKGEKGQSTIDYSAMMSAKIEESNRYFGKWKNTPKTAWERSGKASGKMKSSKGGGIRIQRIKG